VSTTAVALAHGYGDYALFQWLWHRFHWWGIPIFGAFLSVTGFMRAWWPGGGK
jgi:hypothetical protein